MEKFSRKLNVYYEEIENELAHTTEEKKVSIA
jgi:hypothetical protein